MTLACLSFVCAVLVTGCVVVPPLSRPVPPPATSLPPPVPRPPPVYPAPVVPPPTLPPPAVTAPAEIPPPISAEGEQRAQSQVPQGQLPPTPVPLSNEIALVLPLDSATYGVPAQAVREGFFAAERVAGGNRGRTRVLTHGEDGVLNAVAKATESHVALVVGPLVRDDVKMAITLSPAHPRMLVLNQFDDAPLPVDVYALTLSIDSDAAQLAALARAESVRNAAIVVGNAPLQRRFSAAFATAWRRGGGIPPREYSFDPNPEQLGLLRRELAARPPDAILLAVDGNDAALAKSFLPPVPVFAISQIADGLPLAMLRDLEGVRYVEIPWLADPGAPQFAGVPRPNYGDPVLERLYALGLDAFAVAQLIAQPVPPERIELDGATGHLSLTPAHSFQRDGRVMVIRAGQIGPYESPR